MDERVMQFRVGVFFLATFLITGILLVMFGKMPRMIGTYTIQVRFNAAGGVTRDTPVRKSGILIGRVSDVQLTDRDSKVLVTMDIQADKIIYRNEACYINRDLLGDTAIVFVPETRRGAG
ncbi:MAG: MlaD family protein, partial [Thermoguttaceae bacterium]